MGDLRAAANAHSRSTPDTHVDRVVGAAHAENFARRTTPLAPMYCAVSGNAPEHPVVSTKSGHLFEQSVIEKYIASTGKCPVTGEALGADDLLPLKVSSTVKPRPVAATSIPGMLTLFQNEWDALMLEAFSLKQQLETVRQELGHALYQHDAACRVIARLMKERDDARRARRGAAGGARAGGGGGRRAAAGGGGRGGGGAARRDRRRLRREGEAAVEAAEEAAAARGPGRRRRDRRALRRRDA